jgi:putative copper export protein
VTPDQLSVGVRALAFVALFQATGAGFFLAIFGRQLTGTWDTIRRLGRRAAWAGLFLVLAHLALDATRLSGDFAGAGDWDLQRLAWTSASGVSQSIQAGGLLVLAIALRRRGRETLPLAGLAGLAVCTSFLLTGHTSHHPLRALLAPLLALHLLIVAFWFGSLLPLLYAVRLESPATAATLLERFSGLAVWAVPLIFVAGLTMATLLSGTFEVLRQPYGELLLAKIAGFGLLMVLAARNQWRLASAFATGGSSGALRRSLLAEYALIAAVLSVTAVMTAWFSPTG